jgi:hypothetical protein
MQKRQTQSEVQITALGNPTHSADNGEGAPRAESAGTAAAAIGWPAIRGRESESGESMRLTEESQMGPAAIGERCAAAAVAWRWSLGFDSSRRGLNLLVDDGSITGWKGAEFSPTGMPLRGLAACPRGETQSR